MINWTSARLTTWPLAFSARAALGPMIIISMTSIFLSASCNLKPKLSNSLSTAAWIASRFSIMSAKHLASPALLDKTNPCLLTVRSWEQPSLTLPAWRKFESEISGPQSGHCLVFLSQLLQAHSAWHPIPGVTPPAPTSCPRLQSTNHQP